MPFAPYLLQAFAARILAVKSRETVLRADLVQQGYDVETLVEMIAAYNELPKASRAFEVQATPTEIMIQRKANSVAPTLLFGAPLVKPAIAQPEPKASIPPTLTRAIHGSRGNSITPFPVAQIPVEKKKRA